MSEIVFLSQFTCTGYKKAYCLDITSKKGALLAYVTIDTPYRPVFTTEITSASQLLATSRILSKKMVCNLYLSQFEFRPVWLNGWVFASANLVAF